MVLNNIEITVADCLLNLSRTGETRRTLPPKKRIYDVRGYENRQSKRSRMNPFASNQLVDGCNRIGSQHVHIGNLSPRSSCLPRQLPRPSLMTPTALRMNAYQIGHLQTHPFSPFSSYQREYEHVGAGSPYTLNAAVVSAARVVLKVPVSPGSKTSAESESTDDEEESRSNSIASESSMSDAKKSKRSVSVAMDRETEATGNDVLIGSMRGVKKNEASASVVMDHEIEPTGDDVLIGTGRTCSGHEGNKRFHREIYESCEEYFRADYKKGIVERIIHNVHKRGGRFLANTNKGPWRLVVDTDRLERNTRKSFHMARKQRDKEFQIANPSQIIATSLDSTPQQLAQQIAVYVPEARSFCTSWLESKNSNGDLFVRFSDQRVGADWLHAKTDIRMLSRSMQSKSI